MHIYFFDRHQKKLNTKIRHKGFLSSDNYSSAFTIVELLVVIVIIGILATISLVSYSGIQARANTAAIQANLNINSNLLEMYKAEYGSYPTSLDTNNCPDSPTIDAKYCIKDMSGATVSYVGDAFTFSLIISKNAISYKTTESNAAVYVGSLTCPIGFIVVPGSITYGTSDFCVMKYEAKADDNADGVGDTNRTTGYGTWPTSTYPISASRKLVSSAAGYPVGMVSQITAMAAASSADFVYGCDSGCHLITEAEWMTIAQNVLAVASNWSGGVVGTGYIYSGHNDGTPYNGLVADSNDTNGYTGTGQSSPSTQRRTLTLTNGEVIWDFAGNVWEWTSGQMTGGQPSGMASSANYEWTTVSGGTFATNPYPSGTGLSGSSSWNSANGIGKIYGLTSDATLRGFIRGGAWTIGTSTGVLMLRVSNVPSNTDSSIGFRVASS